MQFHKVINYFIAIVWFINGFICKLLNLVPRHDLIVQNILGTNYNPILTKLIGISEIIMAAWIISGKYSRVNAILQALIIATMNIIEFIFVPELLLWGKWNAVFAALLILLILYNEFYLNPKNKLITC